MTRIGRFYLCGKDYSYVFYINALGNLQQLYYGKKIEESDIGYFISARSTKQNREDINCDFSRNRTHAEIGSFAKGDFRAATVIVKRADGVSASSFVYAAHEIVKGAVKISGMPCTRKADETLIVTLKDECSDIIVRLYYRVHSVTQKALKSLHFPTKCAIITARKSCEKPGKGVQFWRMRVCIV